MNIGFWVIYILVFVGMALQASGARMGRQAKFLREGVEDQLILEQAKGAEGLTREQISDALWCRAIPFWCSIFRYTSCRLLLLCWATSSSLYSAFCKRPARKRRAGRITGREGRAVYPHYLPRRR